MKELLSPFNQEHSINYSWKRQDKRVSGGVCHLFSLKWSKLIRKDIKIGAKAEKLAKKRMWELKNSFSSTAELYKTFTDKWNNGKVNGAEKEAVGIMKITTESVTLKSYKGVEKCVRDLLKNISSTGQGASALFSFWWMASGKEYAHTVGFFYGRSERNKIGNAFIETIRYHYFDPNLGEYRINKENNRQYIDVAVDDISELVNLAMGSNTLRSVRGVTVNLKDE